ncbi:MAG: LytTR family transcriptional regulator DNA-binding domain-containing protein [Eubacterium sp.]|nr:LytTR family transcriptional regulator DNA-binding domain-containing protein [Eubacterium sp.]
MCCPALQNEMEYGRTAVCEIAVLLLAGCIKAGFRGIDRHERKDSVKQAWLRCVMIQKNGSQHVCDWKLKDMEAKIGQYGFARSYSSYLVNLFYVENIKNWI